MLPSFFPYVAVAREKIRMSVAWSEGPTTSVCPSGETAVGPTK
jgi:hypothetical protein